MNISDLIIIYLTCGSPFAVYQVTKRQPARVKVDWFAVIASFLFWPIYAISMLAGRIFPNEERAAIARHNQLEDLRLDIERIAFSSTSITALFEFRETFQRMVGLSEAANAVSDNIASSEICEISGHANKGLASRCLARRNLERLDFHRSRVRIEFVDLINCLAESGINRIELLNLALEVADLLQDETAAAAFRAMASVPLLTEGAWISGLEKEVWKSRTPSTSTTN